MYSTFFFTPPLPYLFSCAAHANLPIDVNAHGRRFAVAFLLLYPLPPSHFRFTLASLFIVPSQFNSSPVVR